MFMELMASIEEREARSAKLGEQILNNKVELWMLRLQSCNLITTQDELVEFATDTRQLMEITEADIVAHLGQLTPGMIEELVFYATEVGSYIENKRTQFGS